MKRSRKRIMSVILAFSIVFGSVGYAFAQEHNAVETNDPFACIDLERQRKIFHK